MPAVEQHAKIISQRELGEGHFAFVADKTVFYPASGGQPSDVGIVRSRNGSAEATVERVTITASPNTRDPAQRTRRQPPKSRRVERRHDQTRQEKRSKAVTRFDKISASEVR